MTAHKLVRVSRLRGCGALYRYRDRYILDHDGRIILAEMWERCSESASGVRRVSCEKTFPDLLAARDFLDRSTSHEKSG
jgi:hypothetical protein